MATITFPKSGATEIGLSIGAATVAQIDTCLSRSGTNTKSITLPQSMLSVTSAVISFTSERGSSATSLTYRGKQYSSSSYNSYQIIHNSGDYSCDVTNIVQKTTAGSTANVEIEFKAVVPYTTASAQLFNFTNILLTITYTPKTASTGTLNKTEVGQNSSITLTISPADSSLSHKVKWGNSTTQSIAAGVTTATASSTILSNISIPANAASLATNCILYTYDGSTLIGSKTYNFTLTPDWSKVLPTATSLTVSPNNTGLNSVFDGIYIQGKSKVNFTFSGFDSGGHTAVLYGYQFIVGSQSPDIDLNVADPKTYTSTKTVNTAGKVALTAKIYNTLPNGTTHNKTPYTANVTVQAYTAPSLTGLTAFRCTSTGAPSANGSYISVKAKKSFSSVSGKNTFGTISIAYRIGTGAWQTISGTLNADGAAHTINAGITEAAESTLQLKCTFSDLITSNVTQTCTIANNDTITMAFKTNGLNISIGKKGTRDKSFEVDSSWTMYHGDEDMSDSEKIVRQGLNKYPANGTAGNVLQKTGNGAQWLELSNLAGYTLIAQTFGSSTAPLATLAPGSGIQVTIPWTDFDGVTYVPQGYYAAGITWKRPWQGTGTNDKYRYMTEIQTWNENGIIMQFNNTAPENAGNANFYCRIWAIVKL